MRHACFAWDAARGAYVMPDLPVRHVPVEVRVMATLKGTDTAHREPYTWPPESACPWCGGDLPSPASSDPADPWR